MSIALYRRYRPESFADVIGQEHVTEPLMQALRSGRVNHAYLFSGPRGCGKTTSARILARCLNCEQGPTDTPCGVCDSCVGLARGGSGTVDVIEIDAASHGGVDDARDLREKASFGPAASRFKVYIIDEAHMVTAAGFNALLKVVEEPPPHVKFVFATTEPEKVIGTIRSRTHHYPFRLVPPARLQDYLSELSQAEGVPVAKGVLPLVVRAGAGSVRDSLSVLDQLIAGSTDDGITYERAVGLLGYTDAALLDSVVEAFAAGDAATVFTVVDRVIESGHEPRRFVEDLLERLRDLVVISAVPDGAEAILRGVPEDQLERMRQQAAHFGAAALSRAADVVNTGLTELTGATSPRLQLELLCARVLLPGADGANGHGARLDRIEKRLAAGLAEAPRPTSVAAPGTAPEAAAPGPAVEAARNARNPAPAAAAVTPATVTGATTAPAPAAADALAAAAPPREPARSDSPSVADTAPGALGAEAIRTAWPEVIGKLFGMKKATWSLVKEHAQVLDFDGRRLVLGISSAGLTSTFTSGAHAEFVRQALIDVLGVDAQVVAVHGDTVPDRGGASARSSVPTRTAATSRTNAEAAPARPGGDRGDLERDSGAGASDGARPREQGGSGQHGSRQGGPDRGRPEQDRGEQGSGRQGAQPQPQPSERAGRSRVRAPVEPPGWDDVPSATEEPGDPEPLPTPTPSRYERGTAAAAGASAVRSAASRQAAGVAPADDEPSADDVDAEDSGQVGRPVVERLLGGRVIDEAPG